MFPRIAVFPEMNRTGWRRPSGPVWCAVTPSALSIPISLCAGIRWPPWLCGPWAGRRKRSSWLPPPARPGGPERFLNWTPNSPHYAAATYLHSLGVLRGYEGSDAEGFLLDPGASTMRMHVAVIVCRVLDL